MITVTGPSGITETFPDGTPPAEIERRMQELWDERFGGGQMVPTLDQPAMPQMEAPEAVTTPGSNWMQRTGETLSQLGTDLVGAAPSIGRGFLDTISLGFDDEIIAAMEGLWRSNTFDERLEEQQAAKDRRRQEGGFVVGQIAGLAPTMVAPVLAPFGNASWLARTGNAALTGAATGGIYGAGSVEGPLFTPERAAGAGLGAAAGAVGGMVGNTLMEVAAPAATAAASWVRNRLPGARATTRATMAETEAARRVGGAIAYDTGAEAAPAMIRRADMLESAQQAGVPMILADTGTDFTRRLLQSASNTSPNAQGAIGQAIAARFDNQSQRISDDFARITGTSRAGDTEGRLLQLQAQAATANQARYQAAYGSPNAAALWSPELAQLTQSPTFRDAMRRVERTAADEAALTGQAAVLNPFVDDGAGGLALRGGAVPNLQYWDHVQRNLGSVISEAQRSGNQFLARQATQLKNELLGILDNAVPEFAAARQGAARAFGAQDALEAGRMALNLRLNNAEFQRLFGQFSAPEQALFREGYSAAVIERLGSSGNNRDAMLLPVFNTPHGRERLEIVFGAQPARQLENMFRLENIFNATRRAVGGQSTTARQLMDLALAGGVFSTMQGMGVGTEGWDWSDPAAIGAALMTFAARRIYGRIDERIAREVGGLLATSSPDNVRRAAQLLSNTPDGNAILRSLESMMTRGAAVMASGGVTEGMLPGYGWGPETGLTPPLLPDSGEAPPPYTPRPLLGEIPMLP